MPPRRSCHPCCSSNPRLLALAAPFAEISDAYGPNLTNRKEIDEKRDNFHKVMTALAKTAGTAIEHSDDNDEDEGA